MEGEIRKIEKEVKKEKTGKELHEEAVDGLDSLIENVRSISLNTDLTEREYRWSEVEARIGLFKKVADKLVEEGIELIMEGNPADGVVKIDDGCGIAVRLVSDLRKELINSMERVGNPVEEIRLQKRKEIRDTESSLLLNLKAAILGNVKDRIYMAEERIFPYLVKIEQNLVRTEEEKKEVAKKRKLQLKIEKKKLQKQKKEMEGRKEI